MTTENTTNKSTSTISIGVVPWGTYVSQSQNNNRQYNDNLPLVPYLKLEKNGTVDVRVISPAVGYAVISGNFPKSKSSYGDKVRIHPDSPILNEIGLFPKQRFVMLVIDRRDNQIKIWDMPKSNYEKINEIKDHKNRKRTADNKLNPSAYDLGVKFDPKNIDPGKKYSIVPDENAVVETDADIIAAFGGQEMIMKVLEKQGIIPKEETTRKRLTDLGWAGENLGEKIKAEKDAAKAIKAEKETPAETLAAPEEDDYNFSKDSE
jgi:hypothetical protein